MENFLDMLEQKAEFERHERVRRYHDLMGDRLTQAEEELSARTEVWKKVAPVVSAVLSRHKVSDVYPPLLRSLKVELLRKCESARHSLHDNDPPWLEQKISQIKNRIPVDFNGLNPQTLANEDSRILTTYIGKAPGYANFAQEVAKIEQEIARLETVFQEQMNRGEFHGLPAAPRGVVIRNDEEPAVVKPDFDPRLG